LLDRTQPDRETIDDVVSAAGASSITAPDAVPAWRRPLGWLQRAGQFFFTVSFSSLTRRIVSLNLAGLIDARAQSLLVQGEIIAGAIAASATVETNTITIDPDRLLDLKPGETYAAPDELATLDFPINPERVAPVLRRLISPRSLMRTMLDLSPLSDSATSS